MSIIFIRFLNLCAAHGLSRLHAGLARLHSTVTDDTHRTSSDITRQLGVSINAVRSVNMYSRYVVAMRVCPSLSDRWNDHKKNSLMNVNVQLVVGNVGLLPDGTADLNGQPCAHFGPDECHLGSQPKLPSRLLNAILCS